MYLLMIPVIVSAISLSMYSLMDSSLLLQKGERAIQQSLTAERAVKQINKVLRNPLSCTTTLRQFGASGNLSSLPATFNAQPTTTVQIFSNTSPTNNPNETLPEYKQSVISVGTYLGLMGGGSVTQSDVASPVVKLVKVGLENFAGITGPNSSGSVDLVLLFDKAGFNGEFHGTIGSRGVLHRIKLHAITDAAGVVQRCFTDKDDSVLMACNMLKETVDTNQFASGNSCRDLFIRGNLKLVADTSADLMDSGGTLDAGNPGRYIAWDGKAKYLVPDEEILVKHKDSPLGITISYSTSSPTVIKIGDRPLFGQNDIQAPELILKTGKVYLPEEAGVFEVKGDLKVGQVSGLGSPTPVITKISANTARAQASGSSGAAICTSDSTPANDYYCRTFKTQNCPAGRYLAGLDQDGNIICKGWTY